MQTAALNTRVMQVFTLGRLCGEAGYVAPNLFPEVKHLMLKPAPALVPGLHMVADLDAT